jgi:hypothetical protein
MWVLEPLFAGLGLGMTTTSHWQLGIGLILFAIFMKISRLTSTK